MTSPQSKRDIQVFIGMVGYYQQFIVDFSKTAQPLFHLLKNEVPFIWSSNCKIAFDLLRKALIFAPFLAYPDFSLPFVIQTDASLYAAGLFYLKFPWMVLSVLLHTVLKLLKNTTISY